MSGGFLSDMNAKVRANLGMRKRGGYFRDEKKIFIEQKKYHKPVHHKPPTRRETERIKKQVYFYVRKDQLRLRKNIIISFLLFLAIVATIAFLVFMNPFVLRILEWIQ